MTIYFSKVLHSAECVLITTVGDSATLVVPHPLRIEFCGWAEFQKLEMSRKTFEIIYPDRSRTHVDAETKEQMLLSGDLQRTSNPQKFVFIGELFHLRSFADMGCLLSKLQDNSVKRRYLGLRITFELRGKRRIENQQTPEGLALLLASHPAIMNETYVGDSNETNTAS